MAFHTKSTRTLTFVIFFFWQTLLAALLNVTLNLVPAARYSHRVLTEALPGTLSIGLNFSKVLSLYEKTVALHSKNTRMLTFQKCWIETLYSVKRDLVQCQKRPTRMLTFQKCWIEPLYHKSEGAADAGELVAADSWQRDWHTFSKLRLYSTLHSKCLLGH
jgi:hypothetical protein